MNLSYKFLAICLLVHLSQGTVYQLTAEVVSDATNWCEGAYNKGWCIPTWVSPAWTAVIPGATWIWETPFATKPATVQSIKITKDFYIGGEPTKGTLYIATDNIAKFWLNSNLAYTSVYGTWTAANQVYVDVTLSLVCGLNHIYIELSDIAGSNQSWSNPVGMIYKLVYSSVYSDPGCGCCGCGKSGR